MIKQFFVWLGIEIEVALGIRCPQHRAKTYTLPLNHHSASYDHTICSVTNLPVKNERHL